MEGAGGPGVSLFCVNLFPSYFTSILYIFMSIRWLGFTYAFKSKL